MYRSLGDCGRRSAGMRDGVRPGTFHHAPNAPYAPNAPTLSSDRLTLIEPLVTQAIADRQLPGAVVVAGIGDGVVYRKAMGNRALRPSVEPMTLDTIFDLASLTKVVATTTAVMQLVEDGQLRLADRVSAYIPGFERYGKDASPSGTC